MTPEQIRRILDPERRRAGFEAWKAEQRGALHTGRVGDSGGTCASKGLDDEGQPQPAAAHPGEVKPLSGFAAWLPTPEQARRFWGDDPMGPRRELADEMQRQRDDAEAEMREALGKLVAADISPHVECEAVERLDALQPKIKVRNGVATITRKTLRKDGGG